MENMFEEVDKTGRQIRLSKERWSHIRKKHPEVENLESIKETIKNPDQIKDYNLDKTIHYYYKYFKNRESPSKYLLIIVKFLNGNGFIITAYFEKQTK